MNNIFSEIEEEILFNDDLMFDEEKIKKSIFDSIINRLELQTKEKRGFEFEEIVYNFFEYMNIKLLKTNKTRDHGLDGIIKLKLDIFGEVDLGLQIKYKLIDSTDIDLFLSALKNFELQLGVIICKDSRELQKYELNSKLRAFLLSRGISIKERLIKENIDTNPALILKLDDLIEVVASEIRSVVKGIYKR